MVGQCEHPPPLASCWINPEFLEVLKMSNVKMASSTHISRREGLETPRPTALIQGYGQCYRCGANVFSSVSNLLSVEPNVKQKSFRHVHIFPDLVFHRPFLTFYSAFVGVYGSRPAPSFVFFIFAFFFPDKSVFPHSTSKRVNLYDRTKEMG